MQKSLNFSLLLICIILSLSLVIAAGSSSGGSSSSNSQPRANNSQGTNYSGATKTTCETASTPKERILCRFKNKVIAQNEKYSVVEEACRGHNRTEECKQLYTRSASCYQESNAISKKRCLLSKSGINLNQGGTFRESPNDVKRNYVVLLLYDLQERIENLEEKGVITSEEGASLVTKIIEIKKLILENTPRSNIVPKIQEFKQEYRKIIQEETQ